MLKKVLNKNLLTALVIGSSLGLTNAGMCMEGPGGDGQEVFQVSNLDDLKDKIDSNVDAYVQDEPTAYRVKIIRDYCYDCLTNTNEQYLKERALTNNWQLFSYADKFVTQNPPVDSADITASLDFFNTEVGSVILGGVTDNVDAAQAIHLFCDLIEKEAGNLYVKCLEEWNNGKYYFFVTKMSQNEIQNKNAIRNPISSQGLTDLTNIVNALGKSIDDLRAKSAGFASKNALDALKSTIPPQMNINNISGKVVSLEQSLQTLTSGLQQLQTTVDDLSQRISVLVPLQTTVNDLSAKINGLDQLQATVNSLSTKIGSGGGVPPQNPPVVNPQVQPPEVKPQTPPVVKPQEQNGNKNFQGTSRPRPRRK